MKLSENIVLINLIGRSFNTSIQHLQVHTANTSRVREVDVHIFVDAVIGTVSSLLIGRGVPGKHLFTGIEFKISCSGSLCIQLVTLINVLEKVLLLHKEAGLQGGYIYIFYFIS